VSIAGIKAGKAFVFIEALDKTGPVLKGVKSSLLNLGRDLQRIGQTTLLASLASLTPTFLSTKVFQDFDDVMKKVEARSEGTADEMNRIREQAKLMGRETAFTAAQIGEMQMRIAQKGFSRAQILDMTPSIVSLARAAGEGFDFFKDADAAASLVTGTIRAFRLEAEDAANVADLMAAATLDSSYELSGLVTSLQYAGPVAEAFNLSLEETLALLMTMSNLEIDPSIAGTALRNLELYSTNVKAQDEFNASLKEATGNTIEFTDAAGNLRPLPDILHAIEIATEGMGTGLKGQMLSKFFGQRAVVPAFGLGPSKDFVKNLNELLTASGRSERVAKEMESGLGGAWRNFLGGVEAVALAIGKSLAPALIDLSKKIGPILTGLTEWMNKNPAFAVQLTMLSLSGVALGAALIGVGFSLKMLSAALIPTLAMIKVLGFSWAVLKGIFFGTVGILKLIVALVNVLRLSIVAWAASLVVLKAAVIALNVALTLTQLYYTGLMLIFQTLMALSGVVVGLDFTAILTLVGIAALFLGLGIAIYYAADAFSALGQMMSKIGGALVSGFSTYFAAVRDGLKMLATDLTSWGLRMFESGKALGNTLVTTWSGVAKALTLGDTQAAWDIGIIGLQTSWMQFVDMIMDTWDDASTFMLETWEGLFTSFKETMANSGIGDWIGSFWESVLPGYDHKPEKTDYEKRVEEFNRSRGHKPSDGFGVKDELDANKASGDRLRDRRKAMAEKNAKREAEIAAKRAELLSKVNAITEKADKAAAEADITKTLKELEDKYKASAEALISKDGISIEIPALDALKGLEQGTSEAAKQAIENMQRSMSSPEEKAAMDRKAMIKKLGEILNAIEAGGDNIFAIV